MFPDRGTVYDFYFVKQASGSWNNWIERVDKAKTAIPKDAKVCCRLPLSQAFLPAGCNLPSLQWHRPLLICCSFTLLLKPGNTWPLKIVFFLLFAQKEA